MRKLLLLVVIPLLLLAGSPAAAAQFTVLVSANAGGAVTPVKGKNLVTAGGSLSVSFSANDGFYLAAVVIDKVPVVLTDTKTFTQDFTNVQQNHTVAARFALDPFIVASATAGGSIDPSGRTAVPFGTDKSFTIQPLTGFHLSKVFVDGTNVGLLDSFTFTKVTARHVLKAFFAINTYPVTTEIVTVPGAANPGTVTPASLTMKHGQTKTFVIRPAAGMRIAEVTVNDVPVADLPATGPFSLPVTVTQDVVIRVTFAEIIPLEAQKLHGSYNILFSEASFHVESNVGGTNVVENTGSTHAVATFDGIGKCTLSLHGTNYSRQTDQLGNQFVNINPHSATIKDCTYSVGVENDVTINITSDGSETKSGWVSPDGNIFVVGGPRQKTDGNGTNYDMELFTGVKAGAGMTRAAISGAYNLVSQETGFSKFASGGHTFVNDSISADRIRATFDGKGGCTIAQTGKSYMFQLGNNLVSNEPKGFSTSDCTYAIAPNGFMAIKMVTPNGPFTLNGWASADGNSFTAGQAALSSSSAGTNYDVSHIVGVLEGSAMSTASVAGTFKFIERNPAFITFTDTGAIKGGSVAGNKITAVLDGSGGCTIHSDGQINSLFGTGFTNETKTADSSACSYTLGTEGALTMTVTVGNTQIISGWLSADGKTIVFGGPLEESGVAENSLGSELAVGVKVQ